jgi:hypothetical protein
VSLDDSSNERGDRQPVDGAQQIPRTLHRRIHDSLTRLGGDVDAWVATADPDAGSPYLIPLSFLWDGETVLISTPAASITGRNLQATGKACLGIGPTRDVILIDGTVVQALTTAEISVEIGDAFAVKTGFDPRELSTPYVYFRIRPVRIQAWREAGELDGRDLMRQGQWLSEM